METVGLSTRAWTTRRRLLLLVAAILAPVILFAGVLAVEFASTERADSRAEAQQLARAMSSAVDRELAGLTAAMESLAASPALAPGGDLADFARQAREVLRRRGYAIVLRDASGQQLLNTMAAADVALPHATTSEVLAADRIVFETGKPYVSDLYHSGTNDSLLVLVDTPVFRGSSVIYALSISLDPAQLSSILAEAARPGWTLTLIDRNDRFIARSRGSDRFIGQPASAEFRRNAQGDSGSWSGRTVEGIETLSAFVRSPASGWRTAVGVALDTVDAPVQRLIAMILISGALTGLLALAVALGVARTISRPIARLADAAARLERGETVPPLHTGLVEADDVGAALASASGAISAREAALQASEERFRAAVRAVAGIMWTNDAAGRMVGEQPGWASLSGQSREEYQGYGWSDAVHPDDAGPTLVAWEAAVRDRATFVFQHRVRCHDGAYRRFAIRAVPTLGADGAITGWVGVHTDITEEFEAKATLQRQEAALRDLNAQLGRRVAETSAERDRIWRISTELMLIARLDGTIVAVNPAWESTLGWTEAESQSVSIFDLVHPDARDATVAEFGRLARGAVKLEFENRYRRKDGFYRWLSWTAVAEVGMVYAIARDVTDAREAAEALQRAEAQLRQSQKMEVVGQLTGGIAHDFNNLLTVVTGHLDMAGRRLDSDRDVGRLRRNISSALEGARRAAMLTHRLLAFSRQSSLQPVALDLNAAIAGMADLIRRTLGENIVVMTALAENLWTVEADTNQFENAVLNLCVNARDAMPTGGTLKIETCNQTLDAAAPYVTRGLLAPGSYASVAVIDEGEGIPDAIRERVFEPFFTTKPVGKGTGLGLSQVFGFMSQSGGAAIIESAPGKGTQVRLLLPRTDAVRREAPGAAQPAATPALFGAGTTCLIVEDQDMVRDFAVAALEDAGYRVRTASDAASALECLDAHPEIGLMFTDIVLAGPMNGFELAADATRRRPNLIVLYTTGYIGSAALPSMAPETEMISKPYSAAELVARISSALASPARQTAH